MLGARPATINESIHQTAITKQLYATTQRKMMQPEPINGDIWACKDASGERVQLQIKNIVDIRSEGAFSQMFSALMTREEEEAPTKVALKEIEVPRMRRDPNSHYNAFYEVFLLRRLATLYPHKRIVELLYTQRCDGGKNERGEPIHLYKLVFPYMPSNLKEQREELSKECNLLDIKLYMWQLFSGLDHLRKARILHRDVKPGNLLVDPDTGQLKIADFGCSVRLRHYYSNFNLPTYAITRPYRPPELLLGSSVYDLMADVWSSGIVFIELYLGRTLFQTPQAWTDEQKRAMRHQVIQMIFKLLGPPSKDELRGMEVKDDVNIVVEHSADRLTMQGLKSELMRIGFRDAQIPTDLFARILQYVPSRRLHGRDLLGDPFFAELFEDGKMRQNGKRISLSIDPTLDLRSIWGTKC